MKKDNMLVTEKATMVTMNKKKALVQIWAQSCKSMLAMEQDKVQTTEMAEMRRRW